MNLYFMRHAHAMKQEEWSGPDAARPLTAKGHEAAQAVALGLKQVTPPISHILTSPYTRALETAEMVKGALDAPLIQCADLESNFDITKLADTLEMANGATTVLLVGHQPSLSMVVSALTGASLDEADLKKAAVALVEISEDAVRERRPLKAGTLRWVRRWDEWDEKPADLSEPIEPGEHAGPAQ